LAELAALSKAKPGTLSYSAPAAPLALFMDNFNKENGADLVQGRRRRCQRRALGRDTGHLPGCRQSHSPSAGRDDDRPRGRWQAPLAAVPRHSDPARDRLSRSADAFLLRALRAERNARGFDQQDRGRCPPNRERAGLPRQAPDRARSRARARHPAGIRAIPGARSGRGAARRQGCRPAAAVTQPEPNSMKILAAILALIAGLASAPTQAQDYPSRPIRALTTTSAGGISDIFVRALGDEMLKRWGQPI